MFCYLGPHLSHDPILFAKVVRIGKSFMKEVSKICFLPSRKLKFWSEDVLCIFVLYVSLEIKRK